MRKLSILLGLLLSFVTINVVGDTLSSGIYRIKNEYNGRGELVYNANYPNVQLNNITLGTYSKNNVAPTGNGTYWYVKLYNSKLYFYNVEANKFMQNSSGTVIFSETVDNQCAFTYDVQNEESVDYIRIISPGDDNKYLSTSCGWEPGPNQVKFRSHEAASDYLSFIVEEAEDMKKYAADVAMADILIEAYTKSVSALSIADALLTEDIATSFTTGSKVGSYDKTKVDKAKVDAQAALDNPERTVETVLAAHNAFLAAIEDAYNRPKVGKTYLLISAYEGFYNNQGVEKAAYIDGKTSGWNTLDETNPIFWWTVTSVEGDNICFQNVASRKYLKHYVANNAYTALTDRPFPFYCKDLGDNKFSLYTYDEVAMSTNGPLHTNSHNSGKGVSGDWRCWGQDIHEMNRWYIVEKSDADIVLVNYVVKNGEDTIMYRPTPAIIGEAYPELVNNPFGTLSGYPTDVVAEGGDVELTYTANYEVAKDVASITKWYAIDSKPSTEKRPLVGVSAGTNIKAVTDTDDYRNGAVKGDDMMWAIVGNPFGYVKLYNKGTGLYAAKKVAGQKKMVTMEEVGDDLVLMQPTAAFTNGFTLRKYGDDVTLWNLQGNYLGGWDSATDAGSVLGIWEITPAEAADMISYTFSAEYGTLIVPFYAEIPEDLEVFTCSSMTGDVLNLTEETSMIKPGVPYIIKSETGSEFEFLGTSKLTSPATATTGLLTGVYSATIAPVGSYVLQNLDDVLGFYLVASDAQPTVGANRCYLTLPAPEVKALYFDQETAIENLTPSTTGEGSIYNLSGQKLQKLQKGINIVNGKKVLF